MEPIELLDKLAKTLLQINKDEFHRTGTAPKLAVCMSHSLARDLTEGLYLGGYLKGNRAKEMIEEQSICGFPVIETNQKEAVYSIIQVHCEGESR